MFPAPSPGMRNQGGATMEEDRQWAAQKLAFDLGMQFRDAWKSSRKLASVSLEDLVDLARQHVAVGARPPMD